MRSGGYTLHHSLTAEAAATVKQAVSLARRRGHAQVSPLHVASAMLSSPAGLLKRACLQSHSHPLQCKALELCFNVALNRLPTSASLGHLHLPSLSNALVAAFKRAQAHQRRGSVENQQQPILALKVEVEQLVISILDDPSVSRVMREAGFSSTHVKSNVDHAISLHKSPSQPPPTPPMVAAPPPSTNIINLSQFRLPCKPLHNTNDDDVAAILDAMSNKKTKNTIIVGESVSGSAVLVKKVMAKFDGKDVPPEMESVQFISVPLSTLRDVSKEEFEVKLGELRSLVKSYVGRGVVLYLGDLGWVADFWCRHGGEERNVFYSPVEYMIMELSRLARGGGESYKRLWLMGVATFQTYEKCRSGGRPSLQTLWSLHPLPLPLKTLALGLSLSLDVKEEVLEDSKELVCCWDCEGNFKREAAAVMTTVEVEEEEFVSSSSKLPSWLQQYKDEKRKQLTVNNVQESDKIKNLSKKWNSICSSAHKKPHFLEKVFNLSSSSSPSPSTSASSTDHLNKTHILLNWPTVLDRDGEVSKPTSPLTKPDLLSNPNSSPNSASSSEASGDMKLPHKFDELTSDNLRVIAAALEKKVPWQKHVASEIATALLKCRSGGTKGERRRESWLGFLGPDREGKEMMAREIASVVFGSDGDFVAVGISSFSSEKAESTEEVASRRKRGRDEDGGSVYDRFLEAVRDNPSRLFFVEDVEEIDRGCLERLEGAMRDGGVSVEGEFLALKDAIVVLCCDSRAAEEREEDAEEKEEEECGPLDLNVVMEEGDSESGIGILDSVDMQVVFRIHVL